MPVFRNIPVGRVIEETSYAIYYDDRVVFPLATSEPSIIFRLCFGRFYEIYS